MPDNFDQSEVGNPVQPCPLARKATQTYWIEIELVGEDDSPVPWEEYRLVAADGSSFKGYLDDEGFARIDGLTQSGTCKISFPALDKEAWQFVTTLPERSAGSGNGSQPT
jgi:hypothetical protein